MSDAPSAMLFCPPQPPVQLSPDAAVSIGRHSSCDLTIIRNAVSRRHAEVRFDGSHYVLRDHGSRNGTFVDSVRVDGETRLHPGARIEIGPVSITFCLIDAAPMTAPDATPMNDALTVTFERLPVGNQAMAGKLEEVPAFAVLQIIEMGRNTGVLEISWKGERARMWFENGSPVHAETEKNVGADAALALVNASEGEFSFESQEVAVEQTIQASITELLLEACRQEDEGVRE